MTYHVVANARETTQNSNSGPIFKEKKKIFPQDTGEWSIFMYSFRMPKRHVYILIIPSN